MKIRDKLERTYMDKKRNNPTEMVTVLHTLSPISDTNISVNAAVKPDFASIATTADGCPLKKTINADARAHRSSTAEIA